MSKFIGDEISRTLQEQKVLERKYEQLIEQRSQMKGMVNKTKYKEIQDEIQDVSRALKESTSHLVRSLKENPNISGNMLKVQRDRNELKDVLLHCMQEIRDRGKYYTITHKVDEENNSRIRFQQLKSREKQLRETVAKLKSTLDEEQRGFQHTTLEQKQAIVQLKQELMTKKSDHGMGAKFRRKESQASVSAIWREFKHQEQHLESRVKQLEEKLHVENIVNNETKEFLGRKISSLQNEIATWEAKYDSEIGDLDAKISLMTTKRNALLDKLNALQDRRAQDVEVEQQQQAAVEAEAERKKQEKLLVKKQNKGARSIQRALRAYVKRKKELEAIKGEGKKAKGGKGKKDKKGKK